MNSFDKENLINSRKRVKRSYWLPIFTILLGVLVVIMLIVSARIRYHQYQDSMFLDLVEDVQIHTSLFHLWLEEYQAGDDMMEKDKVLAHIDEAIKDVNIMLNGGTTDHGSLNAPTLKPEIKGLIVQLKDKIETFKSGETERLTDEGRDAIGSFKDHTFDRLFLNILRDANRLEGLLVDKQQLYMHNSKRLMWGIIAMWSAALTVAILGMIILDKRRSLAREEILESEARYRELFEHTSDYVLVMERNSSGAPVIVDANEGAFRRLGYSRDELISRAVTFITQDEPGVAPTAWNELQPSALSEAVCFEVVRKRKDGSTFMAETSAKLITVSGKEFIYAIERDISKRKEAEQDSQKTERKFRSFFEGSPIALMVQNFSPIKMFLRKNGKIRPKDLKLFFEENPTQISKCAKLVRLIDANRTALDLFEVESQAELAESFNSTYTNKYFDLFKESLIAMTRGKDNIGRETMLRTITGSRINVIMKFAIAPGFEDNWERVLISVTDVTERKKSASIINELGRILDNSLNEIFILDATTLKFIEVNRGAVKNLGYSIEELREMTPLDLKPEFSKKSFDKLTRPLRREEKQQILFETIHKRKDGTEYPIEVHLQHSTLRSMPVYVEINLDISERKRAEEELRYESEITENLLRISEATLHTTDIDRLLHDVVMRTNEIMGSDVTLSYLWDAQTKNFRAAESAGLDPKTMPFFKTEPIDSKIDFLRDTFDNVGVSTKSVLDREFKDALQKSGLFSWLGHPTTIVDIIPLKGRQRALGLLLCLHKTKNRSLIMERMSPKRTALLKAVANHVSTALEEACLYKESIDAAMELSRKVETIQTMSEMGKSILSAHESKVILETTILMISQLVACDGVRVITFDKESKKINFIAGLKEDEVEANNIVNFTDTCLTDVILSGRAQYIPDITLLKGSLPVEEAIKDHGYHSVLRVPIVIKGDIFAVIGVIAKRRSAFTPADRDILEKLASHIGIALENARLISDLEELFISTVKTLAGTIEAKSKWTMGHSDRVTKIAVEIGRELSMEASELKMLELAGLLHDIGKIGTYESILDKPVKLTEEEHNIIKRHPVKGADILSPIKQLSEIIPGVKLHHEFYDGSGYPEGLKGNEIPLMAKILAVADTVDAMGANRPYRKGLSREEIIGELRRCSGTQFDPKVVEAFLKVEKEKNDQNK